MDKHMEMIVHMKIIVYQARIAVFSKILTDIRTYGRTDRPSYRVAITQLKRRKQMSPLKRTRRHSSDFRKRDRRTRKRKQMNGKKKTNEPRKEENIE